MKTIKSALFLLLLSGVMGQLFSNNSEFYKASKNLEQLSDFNPQPVWDKYPTFGGYKDMLEEFQSKYPEFVRLDTIGKTQGGQGRELIIAKVSDNVEVEESEPEFFMIGGIHGNETMGSMICLRLIEYLCENFITNTDPGAQRILDSIELYILPFTNPDGTYNGGDSTVQGAIRGNSNGVDLNRNWLQINGGTPEDEIKLIMTWEKERHLVMAMNYTAGIETAVYPYAAFSKRTPDDEWWKHVCGIYRDLAQDNGPAGYYDDGNSGVSNGYDDLGYINTGTMVDYFYVLEHVRVMRNELTTMKLVYESDLQMYWEANRDATLAYIQEVLNGIRGTVVNEVTKAGLPAKVFVEDHDKVTDSSWVYADSAGGHGNYYRPIIEGTYDVTYSCDGCQSKTVSDIQVKSGEATIVHVELDCGTDAKMNTKILKDHISIISHNNGIVINVDKITTAGKAAIYDIKGKLITTISVTPGANSIIWNGLNNNAQKVGPGYYIFEIQILDQKVSLPFMSW